MFGLFSDDVIEENVVMGLTNELLALEHPEAVAACRKKAGEISSSLTNIERKFIAQEKAKSIIIPFSAQSTETGCLPQGDMVTLVQLVEVIKLLKEYGHGLCIGCPELDLWLERDASGELIVKESSRSPIECLHCRNRKPLGFLGDKKKEGGGYV